MLGWFNLTIFSNFVGLRAKFTTVLSAVTSLDVEFRKRYSSWLKLGRGECRLAIAQLWLLGLFVQKRWGLQAKLLLMCTLNTNIITFHQLDSYHYLHYNQNTAQIIIFVERNPHWGLSSLTRSNSSSCIIRWKLGMRLLISSKLWTKYSSSLNFQYKLSLQSISLDLRVPLLFIICL